MLYIIPKVLLSYCKLLARKTKHLLAELRSRKVYLAVLENQSQKYIRYTVPHTQTL